MTRTLSRFTRAEHVSDVVVHAIGLAMALAAVPVLIWLAVDHRGDAGVTTAIAIYGTTLLTMLICSLIYNATYGSRASPILKRLDHSAIYLKIAGTYTPLVALTGGGFGLLASLWAIAIGGSSLKLIAPDRLKWLGLALYLGMGWTAVVFGRDILAALSPGASAFVIAGGAVYTAGVVFFLWDRLPFNTAIWHGFVVVASGLLYTAMALEVTRDLAPILTVG